MARWKDFFYFNKGDKIAIILLSILICFAGLIAVYMFGFTEVNPGYISGSESAKNTFVEFENNMYDIELPDTEEAATPNEVVKQERKASVGKLAEGQTIDINTASVESLKRIPGIGNTLAERIINYRTDLGGFANLEQLQEIKGITVNKFSNILPYIILKKKHRQIPVNRVSESDLSKHPYLDEKQVEIIVTLRQNQKIASTDDLIENEYFTVRDIARLQPYLVFE